MDKRSIVEKGVRDIRTTVVTGLAASLFIILVSGFFVTSGQDLLLICFGFAAGLGAAYVLESLAESRRHRQDY
ncbi:MAG: hypothetical protein R6V13_08805 [Anaerolineae bacterium]